MEASISLGVLVLLVLVVLVIIGVIYNRIYTKRINKALEEGASLAHNKMAEPERVSKSLMVIAAVIGFIILLANISGLQNRIQFLEHQMNQMNAQLYQEIREYSDSVTELIEEKESAVLSADMTVGALDAGEETVEYCFSILPKVVSDDMKLEVWVGDKKAELKKEDEMFRGSILLNLFGIYEAPVLAITNHGETICEKLDRLTIGAVAERALPMPDCNVTPKEQKLKNGKMKIAMELSFFFRESVAQITKAELSVRVNGTEIERKEVSDKFNGTEAKSIEYTGEIKAGEGDLIELYLDYTDELEYRYEMKVYDYQQKDNGTSVSCGSSAKKIMDRNGTVIYAVE